MRALVVLPLCASILANAQCELRIEVSLSAGALGDIAVALCPNATAYDSEQGCVLEKVQASSPVTTLVIDDLPPGTYAIKAFHDLNTNDRLDTNWLGIPKEPFGFSNDAPVTFGPPEFQSCAFTVAAGSNVVRLKMR